MQILKNQLIGPNKLPDSFDPSRLSNNLKEIASGFDTLLAPEANYKLSGGSDVTIYKEQASDVYAAIVILESRFPEVGKLAKNIKRTEMITPLDSAIEMEVNGISYTLNKFDSIVVCDNDIISISGSGRVSVLVLDSDGAKTEILDNSSFVSIINDEINWVPELRLTAAMAIALRRERLETNLNLQKEVLVFFSGREVTKPGGLDRTYDFEQHPTFQWLTEYDGPGHALVFDPKEGWIEFFNQPSMDDRIWSGTMPDGRGKPRSDLDEWLNSRRDRPIIFLGNPAGEKFKGIKRFKSHEIEEEVWHLQRAKDSYALSRIEDAILATLGGFHALPSIIRPGMSEKEIARELEYHFSRAGAEVTAFPTIVGTGSNSATLHFAPSDRLVVPGDWILVDAGAQINGYVGDVTRMFPSDGNSAFTGLQKTLYDMLLRVQEAAIDRCRVGVEWSEVHRQTAYDLAAELKDLGILYCSADDAVESGAIGLFLPHGVGHMYGLRVRDASGWAPGRRKLEVVAGARPRCNFKLEDTFTLTVEPGCYFIRELLMQSKLAGEFLELVNYDLALGEFADIGGLRIEDNIVVTSDGAPVVLTSGIPK